MNWTGEGHSSRTYVLSPAILEHPTLGRLLFVDPTNPYVPVGYLPQHDQDSFALVEAASGGALVKVPTAQPMENRAERQTEAAILEDGSLSATIKDRYLGEVAAHDRALLRDNPRAEYVKSIEQWVNWGVPGAAISKIEPEDGGTDFHLDFALTSPSYAKVMRGNLLMFKAALVGRSEYYEFAEPTRKTPVMLDSRAFTETARFKLPAGFKVDELPDTADFQTSFGKYHATWKVESGELIFTRALEIRNAIIPAEKYKEVQGFFQHVLGAERAPVVLVR